MKEEFRLFFSTEAEVDNWDPLRLGNRPNATWQKTMETWTFFRTMREALVHEIPMRTTQKHRYSTGTNLGMVFSKANLIILD